MEPGLERPPHALGRRYGWALGVTAAATAIAALLFPYLDQTNIVMVFLLGVVLAALRLGRGPAVLTVVTSVLSFDFLFVTPYFSFAVSDAQYLVTFATMLLVGLVITELTTRLRRQAEAARAGESRAVSLYALARELAAAPTADEVGMATARVVGELLHVRVTVLVLDASDSLSPAGTPAAEFDRRRARQALDGASYAVTDEAGRGYLPLDAPMRRRGVLVVAPFSNVSAGGAEQRRLLDTCAALVALALERVHYVEVAQRTLVGMESERLRSSLLAAISHDLRTPLTAMVGMSESLAMRIADPAARMEADALRGHARSMAKQVENLLDMARLRGGEVRLKRDWQSMEELVGAALANLAPVLRDRSVETDLPPMLPLVRCDAVMMERVLANLLENALKYTPPGARIGVRARVEGDRLVTTVWDEGPGLPTGREAAVFEMFVRGEEESAVPGVGLGLAIARAIVEAHGGSIRGENRSGGGASISFTLPLEPSPPAEGDQVDEAPQPAGSRA